MSFWFFSAASTLSAIWLVIHLTAGEREVGQPLLQAEELEDVVRETQYLCWHFTSVSIACMAGFFGLAAFWDVGVLAAAGLALASGFALCGIGLVTIRGASHRLIPQGWLFVPVAVLGLLGLLA